MPDDSEQTAEPCNVISTDQMEGGRAIRVVPKSNEGMLTDKQLVDYRSQRRDFLSSLLNVLKDPERANGYSPHTVYATGYRAAAFDRWVWEQHQEYRMPPDHEDAKGYLEEVAFSDKSNTAKGKIEEMLHRYSKWLQFKYGHDEWEFDYSFDGSGAGNQPRDFLTVEERQKIRQAALRKGSIPSYNNVTPEERRQWSAHVARVLDKPVDEVGPSDWEKVDGWKITSLIWTSLDAGLRPIEVGRARTSWVDTDNEVLRIPAEESSKNRGNWTVSITERTAMALEKWIDEREHYDRYDGTDKLWLTNHGNPYGSRSLGRILRGLCDDAGIETANRKMSWYAIRHSVGTYMTDERDLAATKAQLRHKSAKTTMKYDQVPVEDRQDALDKMG